MDTSDLRSNSITVSWDDVDGADVYEVEHQADGGSWVDASCGGADNEVTGTQCVASELERGTDYRFRVRAVPASADTERTVSAWSTSDTASTTGPAPREPVIGGTDELTITWESTGQTSAAADATVTWFWNQESDTRITYQIALLGANVADSARSCPTLGTTTATAPSNSSGAVANPGWHALPYSHAWKLSALEDGQVWGLCVVKTWTDEDGNPQYGIVSLAWASTNPDEHIESTATLVESGPKDSKSDTTAIDWYVSLDSGFDYEVGNGLG